MVNVRSLILWSVARATRQLSFRLERGDILDLCTSRRMNESEYVVIPITKEQVIGRSA